MSAVMALDPRFTDRPIRQPGAEWHLLHGRGNVPDDIVGKHKERS